MGQRMHASCVAFGEAGILVTGTAGAGKSRLALRLMALGAVLVADDQVELHREGGMLMAAPPEPIRGRIEARRVGILALPHRDSVALRLVVDLDREEAERLPPLRQVELLGVGLPVLHARGVADLDAVLAAWFRGGGVRLDV